MVRKIIITISLENFIALKYFIKNPKKGSFGCEEIYIITD